MQFSAVIQLFLELFSLYILMIADIFEAALL